MLHPFYFASDFYGHSISSDMLKDLLSILPCPKNEIETKLIEINDVLNQLSNNLTNLAEPDSYNKTNKTLQKAITILKSQITCQKLADIYFEMASIEYHFASEKAKIDICSTRKSIISVINSLAQNNISKIKIPTYINSLVTQCLQAIKKYLEFDNPKFKLGKLNELPSELLQKFSKEELQGKVSPKLINRSFIANIKYEPNSTCNPCNFYGHTVDIAFLKKLLSILPCPKVEIEAKLIAINDVLNQLSDNLTSSVKPNVYNEANYNETNKVLQKATTILKSQITCQKLADIYFETVSIEYQFASEKAITDIYSVRKSLISIINSLAQNNIPTIRIPTHINSLVIQCLQDIEKCEDFYFFNSSFNVAMILSIIFPHLCKSQLQIEDNKNKPLLLEDDKNRINRPSL